MYDQELREGERRRDGEGFKKFARRRLLIALITLVAVTLLAFFWFTVLAEPPIFI